MAAAYQVNISITAGANFAQEFYVTNTDMSPRDVTGCIFAGNISKHAVSINAVTSTSGKPVYKVIPFKTRVVDGHRGVIEVSLTPHVTNMLKEGKYVYDVVIREPDGGINTVVGGLAFVSRSFGHLPAEVIWDGGGATGEEGGIILDGGGATL